VSFFVAKILIQGLPRTYPRRTSVEYCPAPSWNFSRWPAARGALRAAASQPAQGSVMLINDLRSAKAGPISLKTRASSSRKDPNCRGQTKKSRGMAERKRSAQDGHAIRPRRPQEAGRTLPAGPKPRVTASRESSPARKVAVLNFIGRAWLDLGEALIHLLPGWTGRLGQSGYPVWTQAQRSSSPQCFSVHQRKIKPR